jgi:hypothetical protein
MCEGREDEKNRTFSFKQRNPHYFGEFHKVNFTLYSPCIMITNHKSKTNICTVFPYTVNCPYICFGFKKPSSGGPKFTFPYTESIAPTWKYSAYVGFNLVIYKIKFVSVYSWLRYRKFCGRDFRVKWNFFKTNTHEQQRHARRKHSTLLSRIKHSVWNAQRSVTSSPSSSIQLYNCLWHRTYSMNTTA